MGIVGISELIKISKLHILVGGTQGVGLTYLSHTPTQTLESDPFILSENFGLTQFDFQAKSSNDVPAACAFWGLFFAPGEPESGCFQYPGERVHTGVGRAHGFI